MIKFIILSLISNSLSFPISGSGYGSASGIETYTHYPETEPSNKESCGAACNVGTVIMLLFMSICLFFIFTICTYVCMKECVIPKIKKWCNYIIRCFQCNSDNNDNKHKQLSLFRQNMFGFNNINPINEDCSICLELIEHDKRLTLRCGHAFHTICMKQYSTHYNYNNLCPMCRVNIDI